MSVINEFQGVPIEDLVAAPLIAAASTQEKLASMTADFIQKVGVKSDGSVNTVEFKYCSKNPDGADEVTSIDVPLLSIINIPNLCVKKAEIAFTMEVKTQSVDTNVRNLDASLSAGAGFAPFSVKISGSVTTKSEHTRSSDKSAKYDIKVEARDDGMPEGLARVLDIMASNIRNSTRNRMQLPQNDVNVIENRDDNTT
jgi:hypothetical protein